MSQEAIIALAIWIPVFFVPAFFMVARYLRERKALEDRRRAPVKPVPVPVSRPVPQPDPKDYKGLLELPAPAECHLWEMVNLSRGDLDFEVVETYESSGHLGRCLLKCRHCGQLYYYEFYEVVDWEGGNDDQYWTYIPVPPNPKLIENLNHRSPLELLGVFPRIQEEKGGEFKWNRKEVRS